MTYCFKIQYIAHDYVSVRGFKGTFLIELQSMKPIKHQYNVDMVTVIGFFESS
ncbi:hypothetical protein SAMN05444349_12522 [Bacteroides faecichinchillae]|uniref:Uncharacterized protein n=1 Tax=Bacteroides faecichinchillae TaxID=871325 RepID=A0A1M5CNR4_9BACE|nr:hypothetical protein SAMN05444349_12522 [Bacteroides faecichinchillae]